MASIEKKVRQAGWSKRPYSEAREQIARALSDEERSVRFKRRKCAHAWEYDGFKTFSFWKGGWHEFHCKKCGKRGTTSSEKKAERMKGVDN